MRAFFKALQAIAWLALSAYALSVDTTLYADGSPGPYELGDRFIDPGSLHVTFIRDQSAMVPPYTFVESVNGILFSEPLDSGIALRVQFEPAFQGLRKTYSLFPKTWLDTADTALTNGLRATGASLYERSYADNLSVSGYKSIGVSVGNSGQMNLEQALEVKIYGEIAPGTELSANLSDQGTSLEGATREIGQLDMVYISLTNPRYEAIVGDQFVSMPAGGILAGSKKIKGISAGYNARTFSARAYGAIAGGKYAQQTIDGQVGRQGPYYLRGGGEAEVIQPVRGTVVITVDGSRLREGREHDFIVDYDLGSITFTPRFPIDDEQVIRAEYEYKTFDYQRTFSAVEAAAAFGDSAVSIDGVFWYEADNRNHPIETELSPVDKEALRAAGDSPPEALTGRRVDPKNVAEYNELYRLYRLDSAAATPRYVFAPYDRSRPRDNRGYYIVNFRDAGPGGGDYERVAPSAPDAVDQCPGVAEDFDGVEDSDGCPDLDHRGHVYRYVGAGRGSFSAKAPVSAPRRDIAGQVRVRARPVPWFSLETQAAGEEQDRNLFSSVDDGDNTAGAARGGFILGSKEGAGRGAWLSGDYRLASRRFSRETLTPYERKVRWDREERHAERATRYDWRSALGARLGDGARTEFGYGQYVHGDSLLTDKLTNDTRLGLAKNALLTHAGALFRHHDRAERYAHRQETALAFDFDRIRWGVRLDDEVRIDPGVLTRGVIGGGVEARYEPLGLEERVYYSRSFRGVGDELFSADTGSQFRWSQAISYAPSSVWKIGGTSSYQRRTTIRNTRIVDSAGATHTLGPDTAIDNATLITATSEIASARTGFASRQEYRVSSERASAFIQTPVYAGRGLGAYAYDPATGEYVESDTGSFILYETAREVYDTSRANLVRKTAFSGDWSFRPPEGALEGILADLRWRGVFTLEEHLQSGALSAGSWIPGYTTLADTAATDSIITFSHLSYRQDISWAPARHRGAQVNIYVHPAHRALRAYRERTLELGGEASRERDPWFFGVIARALRVRRKPSGGGVYNRFAFLDWYAEATQRYAINEALSVSLSETVGRAIRIDSAGTAGGSPTDNSYVMARPGLRFVSGRRGYAALTYTLALVAVPEVIDYRMARGFGAGLWHTLDLTADIRIGDNFSLGSSYRMEYSRSLEETRFGEGLHVVSLEMKAFL